MSKTRRSLGFIALLLGQATCYGLAQIWSEQSDELHFTGYEADAADGEDKAEAYSYHGGYPACGYARTWSPGGPDTDTDRLAEEGQL